MKVKTTYKKILVRTFLIFFAFYLVMMGIFTFIYQQNQRKEYSIRIINILNYLKGGLSQTIADHEYAIANESGNPRNKNEDNYITDLNMNLSSLSLVCNEESYVKAELFNKDGNSIGKSGNLITFSENIPISTTKAWNLYRYINLDKYMSSSEILQLFQVIKDEKDEKDYSINVSGYINGSEVIPKTINIYQNQWKENEKNSYTLVNKQSIKQYNFNPQNISGLKPIEMEDGRCYFQGIYKNLNNRSLENLILDEKTVARYSKLNEINDSGIFKSSNKNDKNNISSKNGFYKVEEKILYTFTVNSNVYYLSINAFYYPLEIAMIKLIPMYIFSFIMTIILTIILAKGLYGVYKKQQLLEKNRQELTNAIGHELKTPLGIIRACSEVIREKISEEKRDHYLAVITDEVDNMDKMILEMLDLSKLESQAYELKKEKFSLIALVNNILNKEQIIIENKNIQVNFKADKEYELEADHTRIKQVVSNLFLNAMENTKEMNKIEISLIDGKFTIENQGEHISKEHINFIWDSFYKGNTSKEKYERGTGLGLAIVKNILNLHDMTFGVRNTESGVEFWFKFA